MIDNRVAHRRSAGAIDQDGPENGLHVPLLRRLAGAETHSRYNRDGKHGRSTWNHLMIPERHFGHWSTIILI